LGDRRGESVGERGLGGHKVLLDVLGRVLAGRQQDVVVGVVGAGALEDLEVDLLSDFGLDGGGVFPGGSAHPGPPRGIIARGGSATSRALGRVLDSLSCACSPLKPPPCPAAPHSSTAIASSASTSSTFAALTPTAS